MSSSATVPFFKKPSAKIANARRRAAASRRTKVDSDKSDDDNDDDDESSANSSASDSDDESRRTALKKTSTKKRKIGGISDTITSSANGSSKTGVAAAADVGVGVEHKGSGSAALSNTTDITKKSAMYDEDFLLGKKKLKPSSDEVDGEVLSGDAAEALEQQQQQQQGIYRGNANYAKFITPREQATRKVGPMKSASNIRSTTVTDYQPDVCKDYKQTGFCGYGDSCKFVHMRENYKAGWQLDKEWEEVQRKKNKAA
ncbi:hypothetical protein BZA70DRAFT_192104 [Myxozyma melibiosi]|uniref:Pre-mRNA-splicing factor CWC24 n=1 Tax=Myxozyma melibiosi TaxID=54550 RepID=A0ABR1F3N2_9ASCO